jgi:hypothetical protein
MNYISELAESYRTNFSTAKERIKGKASSLVNKLKPYRELKFTQSLAQDNYAKENISKLTLAVITSAIIAKIVVHPQEVYETTKYIYIDNPLIASFAWTITGFTGFSGIYYYAKTHPD